MKKIAPLLLLVAAVIIGCNKNNETSTTGNGANPGAGAGMTATNAGSTTNSTP